MEYSEISKSIKEREFAIFCGAGISWNSGLPLANELKQSILEKLPIDKKDMDEVKSSNLPFEAFMEVISGEDIISSSMDIDISNVLDIYKAGEPNTNHILIARLAENGYLKTIFTTNFDLLIEKALEKEGLKRNRDFEVYYDEEQFSGIDFENIGDEIIRIFKIHGSVDNKESIRTITKAVASKTLSDKRTDVIRYLFSTGKHRTILILGYSCSDLFDITPQIQSIEENQKEIIFVEHSNEEYIEDIKIKDHNNSFKKFSGKRIKCNTDKFVKHLWNPFKENIGAYVIVESTVEWKRYVDDWDKGLEENKGIKYYIIGSVFSGISSFNKSIKYYKEALEIAKDTGDKVLEPRCCGGLGYSYYRKGDLNKAIEYYKEALEIAKDTGDKVGESRCYVGLGFPYYRKGDFKKTIEYHEKGLEIAKDTGDKVGESRCHIGLGYAYCGLRDFKKTIEYFLKAEKIIKEMEENYYLKEIHRNLFLAYEKIEEYENAEKYKKLANFR